MKEYVYIKVNSLNSSNGSKVEDCYINADCIVSIKGYQRMTDKSDTNKITFVDSTIIKLSNNDIVWCTENVNEIMERIEYAVEEVYRSKNGKDIMVD